MEEAAEYILCYLKCFLYLVSVLIECCVFPTGFLAHKIYFKMGCSKCVSGKAEKYCLSISMQVLMNWAGVGGVGRYQLPLKHLRMCHLGTLFPRFSGS